MDSGLRGDQQIKITGTVRDNSRNLLVKFAALTMAPGIVVSDSTFGLPNELKSNARAKLGG